MSESESAGTAASTALGPDGYARFYQEHHTRLVAYAYSLTRNSWLADDLAAEAHFRVWRRISAGHQVDNVAAYLAATVRNLAATVGGRASREVPSSPQDEAQWDGESSIAESADPQQRVAHVELLADVLKQLPDRWAQALWLAEVEDLPVAAVGQRIGTNPNATAVLLHRARERMRQAFLGTQPGAPADPACATYWERMPAHVRGTGGTRATTALLAHADQCEDCRDRLALLEQANRRLPALLGPALLVLSSTGLLRLLPVLPAAGGAAPTANPVDKLRHARHLRHGVKSASAAGVVVVAAVIATVAALAEPHPPASAARQAQPKANTGAVLSGSAEPAVPAKSSAPPASTASSTSPSQTASAQAGSGQAATAPLQTTPPVTTPPPTTPPVTTPPPMTPIQVSTSSAALATTSQQAPAPIATTPTTATPSSSSAAPGASQSLSPVPRPTPSLTPTPSSSTCVPLPFVLTICWDNSGR